VSLLFSAFEWDDGNTGKCEKHGVSRDEIEALFSNTPLIGPDIAHSTEETRFRAFGRVESERAIFVVFTLRSQGEAILLRPISARYMHAKEVAFYDDFIAKSKGISDIDL
jgi:uncharacterized protein